MSVYDKIEVTSRCSIVFDHSVDDRNFERPHVHVLKNNSRVATISLETTRVQGRGMTPEEEDAVCNYIDSHQRELIRIYDEGVNKWM